MSHTFYSGPRTPRLDLATWGAIESADAAGALDESRWIEKKVALPPSTSSSNLELARDCASLSRHGGLLVIGIHDKRGVIGITEDPEATTVRIVQVCEARISPPLYVDVTVVHAPPGWALGPAATTNPPPAGPAPQQPPLTPARAVLIVSVPASGSAPHMVDGKYWGRTDHGKTPLADPEISDLMAARTRRHQVNEQALKDVADELGPIEDTPDFASIFTFTARPTSRVSAELTSALHGLHRSSPVEWCTR